MSMAAAPDTATSGSTSNEPTWGRVLIAGGIDWPRLGKKEKSENDEAADLASPHILRSLALIKAVAVHGGPSACHFVVRALDGSAYLFGRNNFGALGTASSGDAKAGKKAKAKDSPSPTDEAISENAPLRVTAAGLPNGRQGQTIVHAACARSHTLLVGSGGQVWAAGLNNMGQCGVAQSPSTNGWVQVRGPWSGEEKPIQVAAGPTFSLILTSTGQVYACGSGEHGQLGNGRTGESIVMAGKTAFDIKDSPIPVKGMEGKKIVQIAAGNQHGLALTDAGLVYVWGFNGYGRLGLGHSHSHGHSQDVLIPIMHPNFAGPSDATMGARITAGPTCSVVVDRQGMYWLAGKWKSTGDGSGGQPFSSFRYLQDIMTCKMTHVACGGVTLFAIGTGDGVIGWGQAAANSELGLGEDQPKSATKPLQVPTLIDVDVFDIAAGQNTTVFLARPTGEPYSELERHPSELEVPEECLACDTGDDEDESNPLLACDKCDEPYHLKCLEPPLSSVPEGEWFCPRCEADPSAALGAERPPWKSKSGKAASGKRKASISQGKSDNSHVKRKK